MRTLVVALVLASVPAHAGKPTGAQAKTAAAKWIATLAFKGEKFDATAAAAQSGKPFFSVAYDDDGARCAAATAQDDRTLASALSCLHAHGDGEGRVRVWTKRDALHLWGPLRAHANQIKTLEKTATLVVIDDGCLSEETTLILAIAGDKKGTHVTAALVQHQSCTE